MAEIITAITAAEFGAFVVRAVVQLVVGFALGAAANVLLGKKPPGPAAFSVEDPGRTDTIRQAAAPRATIYGETRVGGVMLFAEASGGSKNEYLSVLVGVAGHEIAGFEEFFFGDEPLVRSGTPGSGWLPNATFSGGGITGRFGNHAAIADHLGTDTQAADAALLLATDGTWTTAHRLRGVAYYHARLRWPFGQNEDSGHLWQEFHLDTMRVRVRGKLLYDPRDAGTRYSNNPALAIRDYLVNRMGVTAAEIDDTTVNTAANTCEEQVTLVATTQTFTAAASTDVITLDGAHRNLRRGCVVRVSTTGTLPTGLSAGTDYYWIPVTKTSGQLATTFANALAAMAIDITGAGSGTHTNTLRSEPRYTVGAVVLDNDNPNLILRTLAAAMGGVVSYTGGKWGVWAGEAGTATLTLDEDDLTGPITVNARRSRRYIFNKVKALYVDPDLFWQKSTAPGIENATYLSDDNGEEIWQDIQLPFTDTDTAAQRLAKIELERARQQITIQFPAKLTALQLRVWDVVNVTHSSFGWSAKKFRVLAMQVQNEQGILLTLAEEADAMWAWSAEETTVDPAPDTNLPDYRTVDAPPTPITVTEELRITASGTVVTILNASVQVSGDQFTTGYIWEWKKSTDSTYTAAPDTRNAKVEIPNVIDGATYDIRVRAVNSLGFKSATITKSYSPMGQTLDPEDVTFFAVNVVEHEAVLTWAPVSDIDLSHYVIRHSKQTTATWSTAIPLVKRVGKPATSVTVKAMTGTYLIKAVDLAGNESNAAASIGVSIESLPHLNVSETITEETGFSGTHSNTFADAGKLWLHTTTDVMSSWSLMSAIENMAMGEDGGAVFLSSGTYTFANSVNQGRAILSRFTSKVEARGENFDNLVKNWPLMSGVLSMAGVTPSDWDVTLQIRTTTDDPTGAPSWSAWQDFVVGDYYCWGAEFRVRLESTFGQVTPIVSELQVNVDMPDVFQDGANVTVAAGGSTITYPIKFFVAGEDVSIAVSGAGLATGDYYRITNKGQASFDLQWFNSSDVGVERVSSWQAQGY